jgi:hypothetical protein
VEQALIVAAVLRRFQIGSREIARRIWRPALAAAAMALVLYGDGPGWTDNPNPRGLIQAAVVGSLTYGVVLAGTWMLAGRPSGPETDVLALLRHTARRQRASSTSQSKQCLPPTGSGGTTPTTQIDSASTTMEAPSG